MTITEIVNKIADEIERTSPPMPFQTYAFTHTVVERAIALHTEGHSSRTCSQCGEHVQAGQARIAVQFDLNEIEELIFATSLYPVKRRFLCAMALLDPERADRILAELKEIPSGETR